MSLAVADFVARLAGAHIPQSRFDHVTGYVHLGLTRDGETDWVAVRVDELLFGEGAKPFARAGGVDVVENEPARSLLIDPEETVDARERVRDRLRRSGLRRI
jgi:hypothetical protein